MHAGSIRYLETIIRTARNQADTVVVAEDMLEIAEAVPLFRMIVDGRGTAVRGLDAEAVANEVARNEIGVRAVEPP